MMPPPHDGSLFQRPPFVDQRIVGEGAGERAIFDRFPERFLERQEVTPESIQVFWVG
jgi:hypothetical protein